jgi:integrase
MKKNGRADETINRAIKRLKHLSKLCNINNPEQVKETIATQEWLNSTKLTVTNTYKTYAKYKGITVILPKYRADKRIPYIPLEEEINQLIASSGNRTATLLQFLKETACRIGEATQTEWQDIDFTRKTVMINHPEKHSNARILPISNELIAMLNRLPRHNTTNKVFTTSPHGVRMTFERTRNKLAKKLSNPRLLNIHLHTFRHFTATMEYHKTKDIMHVKAMLGHKTVTSTEVYINLEQALFNNQNSEWTTKVAHNETELCQLLENGYEYVTDYNTNKILRKRK